MTQNKCSSACFGQVKWYHCTPINSKNFENENAIFRFHIVPLSIFPIFVNSIVAISSLGLRLFTIKFARTIFVLSLVKHNRVWAGNFDYVRFISHSITLNGINIALRLMLCWSNNEIPRTVRDVLHPYGKSIVTKYGHGEWFKLGFGSYTLLWHDRFVAEHKLTLVMCSTEFIWYNVLFLLSAAVAAASVESINMRLMNEKHKQFPDPCECACVWRTSYVTPANVCRNAGCKPIPRRFGGFFFFLVLSSRWIVLWNRLSKFLFCSDSDDIKWHFMCERYGDTIKWHNDEQPKQSRIKSQAWSKWW